MSFQLQVTIALAVTIAMIVMVLMVRKKRVELRDTLIWFLVGSGVLVFAIFPGLMIWLSNAMGIADPVNMLFFVGFFFLLVIIFTLTVTVSRMSRKIKDLAQEMALLQSAENKNAKNQENEFGTEV